jgi:myosin-crossreactive antigen
MSHDQDAHQPRLHVFLGLPVKGGSTDHFVNKPPSGGFVVSKGT